MHENNSDDQLKVFVYFANNSVTKECVHLIKAYNWLDAVNTFANLKQLSFHDFLEIYSVEEKAS